MKPHLFKRSEYWCIASKGKEMAGVGGFTAAKTFEMACGIAKKIYDPNTTSSSSPVDESPLAIRKVTK